MSESTDTIYIPKINDEQEYMQSYYTVADPSSIRDQVQNRGGNINAFMRFSIISNQNQLQSSFVLLSFSSSTLIILGKAFSSFEKSISFK